MKNFLAKKTYTIDARGKHIGRVASEVATLLMGKNEPDFARNMAGNVSVTVKNAGALDISQKRAETKIYSRYSGYPGGLKQESMEDVLKKKDAAIVLTRAIYGMLPGNRLRAIRLKNLKITI
jgi:large subunit ribosomal protein L13